MTLSSGNLRLREKAVNGKSPLGIFPPEKEPKSELNGLGDKLRDIQVTSAGQRPCGILASSFFVTVYFLFVSFGLTLFNDVLAATKKSAEFYLIVSKDSPLKSVSPDEVKKLYRRKTNEMQGQAYTPIHYEFTDITRKEFSESVLDWPNVIREEEMLRLIKFRNERTVPIQVLSVEQMLERVANGGTVGYMRSENIQNLPSAIKAIPIF